MTPTPEAGTELRGADMRAALTAVSVGLMNSPGFEIGVEAVVLKQLGGAMIGKPCKVGKKRAAYLCEITEQGGGEHLARDQK